MTKRGIILLVIATCWTSMRAISFDTQRLERLAIYLSLQQLDTLPIGVTNTYSYKQHPLTIRKNQWGEIEHIGLLLFPQAYRKLKPMPIYDFLERYLLARMATPAGTEDAFRLQWARVHFNVGNPATALKIDTTAIFTPEYIDLRAYRVAWKKNGKTVLELSFTMDFQLLIGCDAVELEHRLIRHLSRYQPHSITTSLPDNLPTKGKEYTLTDSYYMSPMVRNDIYYTRKSEKKEWVLVNDAARPTKTINNWMVAPDSDNELTLEIGLDKYGYEVDSLQTTYRAWQHMCIDEGCHPYYGLKAKKEGMYEGSVFMVNQKGGYVHLLSINIPESALKDRSSAKSTARLYAYIPLYNVSAQLIHHVEYEPIK